jgi:hypothetical protein
MKHKLILFSLVLISTAVFAQKKKTPVAATPTAVTADQARTKNFLLKTSRFTGHTHRAVLNGKAYTGNLGKMVQYQRKAKALYEAGKYQDAIYFSRRARLYGLEALKANKAIPTSDGKFSIEEETLSAGIPTDEAMEAQLAREALPTDESLMGGNLAVEIK